MGWECPECKIAVDPGTSDTTKCAYLNNREDRKYDPRPDGKCKICEKDEGAHYHHTNGNKYCDYPRPAGWPYCCNCAKNAEIIWNQLDGANWSRLGCQHCQDRRSQDYRCQAYQAKGMMNGSCKFCDQGKDAHFKGVYSKKLFCTDPRHDYPRLCHSLQRQWHYKSRSTATADANGTTNAVIPPVATTVKTILCASCGKHGADGDIFCRGCGAPLATNVDESAPRDALSAASAV